MAGYQMELLARGWTVFEAFGHRPGGFTSGEMGEGNAYRRGGQGPLLMVAAIDREAAPTELRLRLDWEMIRHLPQMQRHGVPAGQERMPSMYPPAGVELRGGGGGGGGGGDGNWHSDASVETSMPVAELESHFAAQLERAAGRESRVAPTKSSGGAPGRSRATATGAGSSSSSQPSATRNGCCRFGSRLATTTTVGGCQRSDPRPELTFHAP
ncbi:MAG TPA: hypothetical protein VGU71_06260 [Candidatus Dormibacteraeota bacterium]|nr:hypothetical protein [Candidatus Dormibacteraeota bacterium]